MDTANDALVEGNLLDWIDELSDMARSEINDGTIDADDFERTTYRTPGLPKAPDTVHVRYGLADIMVTPVAVHKVTGAVLWEAQTHTHDDVDDARECYRHNVRENRQRAREFEINPERASMRQQARAAGMSPEDVDRAIPLTGEGDYDRFKALLSSAVAEARQETGPGRPSLPPRRLPAVTSASDDQPYDGPTGFYL
jgi:hypothetical protein